MILAALTSIPINLKKIALMTGAETGPVRVFDSGAVDPGGKIQRPA